MKKGLLVLGMVAMVLAVFISCDDGGGTNNGNGANYYIDNYDLKSGTPSDEALKKVKFTEEGFNQIKEAASGGYKGWTIVPTGELLMVWTGRSKSHFDKVRDVLESLYGGGDITDKGICIEVYNGYHYLINFFYKNVSSNYEGIDYGVPAGTLIVYKFD